MINNNLQFAREELGMTQSELGSILGVHKSTISGWENGYNVIPFKKLIKFCNLYNYSLDFICGFKRSNTKYSKINPDKKIIGEKIKSLRKRLHLTQAKIASECAISQTTYSTYENGVYLISTLSIYTICKNHKISMDEAIR